MRLILSTILTLLLLLALGALALAFSAVEDLPAVTSRFELSHKDMARAREILAENDPRRRPKGGRFTSTLAESDLDLAANFLMRRFTQGAVKTDVRQHSLGALVSVQLPENPIGTYLNIGLRLDQTARGIDLNELRFGRFSVPVWLSEPLYRVFLNRLFEDEYISLLRDSVKELRFAEKRILLTYEWDPILIGRARERLLTPDAGNRLRRYQTRLAFLSRQHGLPSRTPLSSYLQPLFRLAKEQSADGGDPVAENRAAILVLAAYVSGGNLARLFGNASASNLPRPQVRPLYLRGRVDLAQHFMVSAALASEANGEFANAVGLYKEIDDSRGGSGFSFSDLAADLAGSRFGIAATGTMASAQRVQDTLSDGIGEADLLPAVTDLPAPMNQTEFERRFGDTSDPRYAAMKDQIEARVSALALYR